jgi:hypothetical protein
MATPNGFGCLLTHRPQQLGAISCVLVEDHGVQSTSEQILLLSADSYDNLQKSGSVGSCTDAKQCSHAFVGAGREGMVISRPEQEAGAMRLTGPPPTGELFTVNIVHTPRMLFPIGMETDSSGTALGAAERAHTA